MAVQMCHSLHLSTLSIPDVQMLLLSATSIHSLAVGVEGHVSKGSMSHEERGDNRVVLAIHLV